MPRARSKNAAPSNPEPAAQTIGTFGSFDRAGSFLAEVVQALRCLPQPTPTIQIITAPDPEVLRRLDAIELLLRQAIAPLARAAEDQGELVDFLEDEVAKHTARLERLKKKAVEEAAQHARTVEEMKAECEKHKDEALTEADQALLDEIETLVDQIDPRTDTVVPPDILPPDLQPPPQTPDEPAPAVES